MISDIDVEFAFSLKTYAFRYLHYWGVDELDFEDVFQETCIEFWNRSRSIFFQNLKYVVHNYFIHQVISSYLFNYRWQLQSEASKFSCERSF